MEHHEDVVLQQRIRSWSVGDTGWSERKGVGRAESQQEEEQADHEHDDHGPRQEDVVTPFAELDR
ncbi:MAG: hypothetical protein RLZ86_1661, partial [Actinomycetota bacterium]